MPDPGPIHFFELDPESLDAWCRAHGMPGFVPGQLLDWVYGKGVVDPDAMTNISARNRVAIAASMRFYRAAVETDQHADDGTRKLLLAWDGRDSAAEPRVAERGAVEPRVTVLGGAPPRRTECVMIPSSERRTACVSSQIGCPVGCTFCASGLGGLEGNLTAGQIVEQVHRLRGLAGVGRISNVVFMGMGEPLANYGAVTDAIRRLNAPWGLGIGMRHITVSTVGLPAAIRRLADFELPVTLALSLHAPNDALRRELIPWAEYATIDELIDACDVYFQATGREITLEYLLLRGVNDRPEHARELAAVAGRLRSNVNLIRYNEVRGLPYDRPTSEDVHRFQQILRDHRIATHIRASRGRDIAAACGQLRHELRR